jgi:hypothetical protein
MNTRALAAVAALATTLFPAVQSHAADLPRLTGYTLSIQKDNGTDLPKFRGITDDLGTIRRWDCASSLADNNETQMRTFTVTCLPKLTLTGTDLPDVCQPGVKASIISLVAGNSVSGTATCGTASASCTATALLLSPTFHGDCDLKAPAPVPGTSVQCAASWPIVQVNTAWSVSCYDAA